MKNKLNLVLALAALICLTGWTTLAKLQKDPARQNWEFLEVELDTRFQSTPKLNQYGSQGWELVGVTSSCPSSPDATISCKYMAYLKRSR